MGRLSQAESLVLAVSLAVALGSALWILGRKRSARTVALGESVWAIVATVIVLAIAATVLFGAHDGQ